MKEAKVLGFAKGKGKYVHAIRPNKKLFCDARRSMAPEVDKNIGDLDCTTCLRYASLKKMKYDFDEKQLKASQNKDSLIMDGSDVPEEATTTEIDDTNFKEGKTDEQVEVKPKKTPDTRPTNTYHMADRRLLRRAYIPG